MLLKSRSIVESVYVILFYFVLPKQIDSLNLQRTVEHYYWQAKGWIKVYTPIQYQNLTQSRDPSYLGHKIRANETKILHQLDGWLYTHDEFRSQDYIRNRLNQDMDLFTGDLRLAVLCYPSCKYGDEPGKLRLYKKYKRKRFNMVV